MKITGWPRDHLRVSLMGHAHALALGALMACMGVRVGVISPRVRETITGKGVDADIDRVGIYNADGSFDATASASYDLADLGWTNSLDVLLITWAAGTGVDIPGEWDRVAYVGASGVPHTVPQVRQMLGRWRKLRSTEVHVYACDGNRPDPWTMDPEQVRERWHRRGARIKGMRLLHDVPAEITDADANTYIRACAVAAAANVSDGSGWLRIALHDDATAIGEGWTEADVPARASAQEKAHGKALDAWRQAHRDLAVEAIVTAPDLDAEQLVELRDRGPASSQEALLLRKDHLIRFYGAEYVGTLDEDAFRALVKRDDRGRRRRHLRRLAYTMAALDDVDQAVLATYDIDDIKQRRLRPDQVRSRLATGRRVAGYLRACGLDIRTVSDGVVIRQEMADNGADALMRGKRLHGFRLDTEVRVGDLGRAGERLRLLTDTLRSIGIRPKVKQVRQGDGRVRVYRVEEAAQARQDGAHYFRGLLHPKPGDRAWSQVEEARLRAGGGGDGIDVVAMFGGDDSSS